jgi:hypothetical protein
VERGSGPEVAEAVEAEAVEVEAEAEAVEAVAGVVEAVVVEAAEGAAAPRLC